MCRPSASAWAALAAGLEGEHDVIPAADAPNALSDSLYHARPLMAEHHRRVGFVPVIAEVYIGAADPRGDKAHQDLVVPWTFHLNGFDPERTALLAQDGRLNLVPSHIGAIPVSSFSQVLFDQNEW